jgi:hypothetical protein
MSKIEKYIDDIIEKGKKEDMEILSDMMEDLIYKMKEYDEECYHKYKMKLYELANGKKLSEEMAIDWVQKMLPAHQHWTITETTNAMQELGYNCEKLEFWVVANMMYNDYYNLVKDDEGLALNLAKDWLKDDDAVEDKLYEYWKHISKKD